MGCVTSKKDINDLHPNIFQVSNVDEDGNTVSSGQLEINETELVFHQRGKAPIRWPLRTLRRYGYENQLFSFETGRRCPTGSGVYAFSCRRAEKLFNYFQSHIQIRNDDTLTREGTVTRTTDYLEPRPRHSVTNGPSRLSSVGSSNASPSPPPNNDYPPPYSNYYVNDPIYRLDEQPPPAVTSPISPTTTTIPESEEESSSPLYMNVGGPGHALQPAVIPEEDEGHCYMNIVPGASSTVSSLPPLAQRYPVIPIVFPEPEPERSVNYIVLDLDRGSPPPPPSPTVRPSSEGYVTIDFDKTVALSHSVNPNCIDNEGSRKTRHNSATPRQSASLSD